MGGPDELIVTREGGSAVKERTVEGFGPRLTEIPRRRGITQIELGKLVGTST